MYLTSAHRHVTNFGFFCVVSIQFVHIIANLAEHSSAISDHAEGLCFLLLCAQQSARIPRVTLLAGQPAFQMHCSDVG